MARGLPLEAGEPQAPSETLVSTEPDGVAVLDALATDAVRAGRVVVLMERHALPESRWAGVRLLPALPSAGATQLAFETSFQEPLDRAQREGWCAQRRLPTRSIPHGLLCCGWPLAVPAEQVIARAEKVALMLSPGRYLCRGLGDADRPVWERSLQIQP